MSSNQFNITSLNNQGAMALGNQNTVTNTNNFAQEVTDATKNLVELLNSHEIPQDMKDDLTETVNTISEQAKSDKPNKTIISSLFGSVDKVISVIEKTPALIDAFDKWKHFITPLFGN